MAERNDSSLCIILSGWRYLTATKALTEFLRVYFELNLLSLHYINDNKITYSNTMILTITIQWKVLSFLS